MHRAAIVLCLLSAPLAAETPAQQAGHLLDDAIARDRAVEATAPRTSTPRNVQAIDQDRRSLSPDVGRPEVAGTLSPGPAGGVESGGPNPQR